MEILKLLFFLGLPVCMYAARAVRYVEYNPPVVYPTKDHVTVEARGRYRLTCEGNKPVVWHLPLENSQNPKNIAERVSITYSTNPGRKHNFTANLEIVDMVYTDTGSYRCSFNGTTDETSIDANTYIHLYVYDKMHLLTTTGDFDFVQFVQYETAVIPCKTTHPNVTVELTLRDKGVVKPDNKYIQFDPKKGFLISPVLPEHTGFYTCEAKYDNKESVYFSNLKVLPKNNYVPPPHINKTSGEHSTVGQTLVLTCSITVDWSIQVRLTWSVPNQAKNLARMYQPEPVSRNVTIGGKALKVVEKELRISQVEQEDQGTYECIVTDHSKNSRKVREFIRIYKRDQSFLRVWVDGSKTVQKPGGRDEQVHWVVNIQAHPPPSVIWYDPDGNVIEEGEDKKMGRTAKTVSSKDVRSVLRLRGLELEYSGVYRAKVENQFSVKWENFSLIVAEPPQVVATVINTPKSGLYNLGDEYLLRCIARGYPTPKIDWTFVRCNNYGDCERKSENLGNSKEITNTRFEVESTLAVTATKSGQYTCIANSNEQAEKSDVDFFVTGVKGGFEISGEERVLEGENVDIRCTVSRYNYSEDSVGWYRLTVRGPEEITSSLEQGVELYNDRSSQFDIVKGLKFRDVKTRDSGKYVCRARASNQHPTSNSGGPRRRHNADYSTKQQKFELRVEPYIAPEVYSTNMFGNETLVYGKGEGVRLFCRVRGTRMPQVEWYKDGVRVSMPHDNIKLLDSSQTLSVGVVVQGIDDGVYSCVAKNGKGTEERIQTIVKVEAPSIYQTNLLGEPASQTNPPKVMESGGSMVLQCRVTGRPIPTIHWTREGEIIMSLDEGGRANFTDSNQTLIIQDIQDKDQGRYECIVNNVGGTAVVFQNVLVEETSFMASIYATGIAIPVFIAVGIAVVLAITLIILAKLCLRTGRCKNPPTPPTPRLTQFDLPDDECDAAESCRLTLSRDGSPFVNHSAAVLANANASAAMNVCHGCAGCSGTCHQCSACHYNFNGIYGCTTGYTQGTPACTTGYTTSNLMYSNTTGTNGSILGVRGCTPVQAGYSPGINEFAMYNHSSGTLQHNGTLQHSQHTLPSSRYNTVKRVAVEPMIQKQDRRSASPRISAEF